MGLSDPVPYYQYESPSVCEDGSVEQEIKTFVDFVTLPTNIPREDKQIPTYLYLVPVILGCTAEIPKTLKKRMSQLGLDWKIFFQIQK